MVHMREIFQQTFLTLIDNRDASNECSKRENLPVGKSCIQVVLLQLDT